MKSLLLRFAFGLLTVVVGVPDVNEGIELVDIILQPFGEDLGKK
jgi:hypothetical protein